MPSDIPPYMGPIGGVLKKAKKGQKSGILSRLGELLNTQKNVHFFAPPGHPRGRGFPGVPKCTPQIPPNTHYNKLFTYIWPKRALFGDPYGVPKMCTFCVPGARARRGPPGRGAGNFPRPAPRAPRAGGAPRRGSQWGCPIGGYPMVVCMGNPMMP